jgi:hypothetical protein
VVAILNMMKENFTGELNKWFIINDIIMSF